MNLLEQLIAITKLIPGHVAECLRGESPVRPSAEIEYCGACGHPWHDEGDGRCAGGSATACPCRIPYDVVDRVDEIDDSDEAVGAAWLSFLGYCPDGSCGRCGACRLRASGG
jgi:hypothetical protein